MLLKGHQKAYVTRNLDAAIALRDARFGKIVFDPDMILKTPDGDKQSRLRAAVGWAGGLNLELIQPVSGWNDRVCSVSDAALSPHCRASRR